MSKFKEFLKMNEIAAGPVKPTLTAGAGWQFPTSNNAYPPTSFSDMAAKQDLNEKPLLILCQKIQFLVQNIVSNPIQYGINNANIVGSPQTGGMISGLDKKRMETIGASKNMKFLPSEFNQAQQLGIFVLNGPNVSINIGELYKLMKTEISKDTGKGYIAQSADAAKDALTTGLTSPGNGAMTLGRHQYNV